MNKQEIINKIKLILNYGFKDDYKIIYDENKNITILKIIYNKDELMINQYMYTLLCFSYIMNDILKRNLGIVYSFKFHSNYAIIIFKIHKKILDDIRF